MEMVYELRGEEARRFERYEAARRLSGEIFARSSKGVASREIARALKLRRDDVEMVLYACSVRATARV